MAEGVVRPAAALHGTSLVGAARRTAQTVSSQAETSRTISGNEGET